MKPTNPKEHERIATLHDQGLSYSEIAKRLRAEGLRVGWKRVRMHLLGSCVCWAAKLPYVPD
jgi:hypothetical protein